MSGSREIKTSCRRPNRRPTVDSKHRTRARIEEIGIVPSVHASSTAAARFAVETLIHAGIPIAEIPVTVPDALELISDLAREMPDLILGVDCMNLATARRAVDAGAMFVTSPGCDFRVLDFDDTVVIPGALTPTEVGMAWQTGADFVKIFPCALVGGARYIRALSGAFPDIPLIASGGVNQVTAAEFIRVGAHALGIGTELIPKEALERRNGGWITELARRFLEIVKEARASALRARTPLPP